jgi:hypothetical protein
MRKRRIRGLWEVAIGGHNGLETVNPALSSFNNLAE